MSVCCSSSVAHGDLSLQGLSGGPPCPDVSVAVSGLFLSSRAWATTSLEDPRGAAPRHSFFKGSLLWR